MFEWMRKPKSGIWHPKEGDNFELSQLHEMQRFFTVLLKIAQEQTKKAREINEAYPNLTKSRHGFQNIIMLSERKEYEAATNLATVNRLISELEK